MLSREAWSVGMQELCNGSGGRGYVDLWRRTVEGEVADLRDRKANREGKTTAVCAQENGSILTKVIGGDRARPGRLLSRALGTRQSKIR